MMRPPSWSVCVSPNVTTAVMRSLTFWSRDWMARWVMAAPWLVPNFSSLFYVQGGWVFY